MLLVSGCVADRKPYLLDMQSRYSSENFIQDEEFLTKHERQRMYSQVNTMLNVFREIQTNIESSKFSKKELVKIDYEKSYRTLNRFADLYRNTLNDSSRALQSAQTALFFEKQILLKQKGSRQTNITLAKKTTSSKSNSYTTAMKYEAKGDYAKALEYQKKALLELEESKGAEDFMCAKVHTKISMLYLLLKQPKEALPHATKALRINKKFFGNNSYKLATNYLNLSVVYMGMDNIKKAYLAMKESVDNLLSARGTIFKTLSQKEKLKSERYNIGHFFYVASLYQEKYSSKKEKIAKEAFNIWLRYKDEISNSESYLIALKSKTKNMEVKAKIDSLIETKKRYSTLYLKRLSNENVFSDNDTRKLKQLENQKNNLERYMSSKIEAYKNSLELKNIDSSQLSQKLHKDELYIDFAHIKHDNSYFSFILNHKNQVSLHKINPNGNKVVRTIESTVNNVLTFLLNGEEENNSYTPLDTLINGIREDIIKEKGKSSFNRTNAKKLYRILLAEPYLDNLQNMSDVKKLIISPDGVLNLLPFEVLIDYNKYLIEEKKIVYVSSGKEFLKAYREKNSVSKSNDIVVFSYLDYENTDGLMKTMESAKQTKSLVHGGQPVAKLTATKDEGETIKDIFTQNSVQTYSEKRGTKEVLNALKSPKILHISTHSFYGKNDKRDVDSLLKLGMALSGYNNYVLKLDTRGIMSALEFSNINLYNTELVLFSSCQSGRGDIHSSEGVYGLNKGAKLAGAKRVISTLWSVDAKKSLELTNRFYEHLKENNFKGYTDALRETKKEMIKKGYHPFFWAGFVENGID